MDRGESTVDFVYTSLYCLFLIMNRRERSVDIFHLTQIQLRGVDNRCLKSHDDFIRKGSVFHTQKLNTGGGRRKLFNSCLISLLCHSLLDGVFQSFIWIHCCLHQRRSRIHSTLDKHLPKDLPITGKEKGKNETYDKYCSYFHFYPQVRQSCRTLSFP